MALPPPGCACGCVLFFASLFAGELNKEFPEYVPRQQTRQEEDLAQLFLKIEIYIILGKFCTVSLKLKPSLAEAYQFH